MDADLFMFECDECAGMPLAPPPQFLIPPPPRPPALAEFTVVPQDCNEDQLAQQQWESDVCQAMPILDASLYSSQSLATSAMIAVFSLLLVLIVLISSLFVWKNKRKVQNLLPCKTPTRGALSGAMPLGGGGTHGSQHHHHAMYEDPDAHLGHHRPLVMRHHQYQHHQQHHHQLHHPHHHHHYQQHPHAELLQGKSIHYPSGYPMTRSPPFLVSSSPGPDPYRSNDNVYEELGPGRVDSDGESEPPLHSDDDFAEDELSLPGECSFHKEANATGQQAAGVAAVATPYHERPAGSNGAALVATSLVATAGTQLPPQERHSVLSSGSSTGQDASTASASTSSNNNNNNNELATGGNPSQLRRTPRSRQQRVQDELNNSSSTAEIADLAPLYDNRSNMMSLGYLARSTAPQFYNTLEHEVERRNRINAQLSQAPVASLSTIYRERIRYPTVQQYAPNSANGLMAATMRARTQPRLVDRRLAPHQHQHHRIHAAPMTAEPAYGYAEPMYNANYYYDSAGPGGSTRPYASTLLPTSDYRQPYGDSSFGSDSGYSHHTPASSIGRQDYDLAEPQLQLHHPKPSKLSTALSFGWHRGRKAPATLVASGSSSNEATSPNNNSSTCSTVTSQLDNNNPSSSQISSQPA